MTDEQQITEQQFKQAQREYYAAQRIAQRRARLTRRIGRSE